MPSPPGRSPAEIVSNGGAAAAKSWPAASADTLLNDLLGGLKVKVGFEADIDITLQESPAAVAVSYESVLEDKDGKKYVFVVENNKAVQRFVKTGLETDFDIQIAEGLKAGEQYVKNPPSTLKNGDPVKQSGGKASDNKS
jgi:HlyD family secretion protein